MKQITELKAFEEILKENRAVVAYFSHDNCNVCKVLKPKLSEALNTTYPKVKQIYINVEQSPDIAGQHSIFTVPVVLLFLDGQESIRKSRNFGIGEFLETIERPYSILFG